MGRGQGWFGRVIAAAALVATVTGCGFRPLYMHDVGRPGPVQVELSAIAVGIIPDRPGQLLQQALQEALSADQPGAVRRYNLAVSFGIAGEAIGIRPDTSATRERLVGTADWVLRAQNQAGTVLTRGSARSLDALNVLDQQPFAADQGNEAVQHRLALALAQQIAQQIAIFFATRTTG